MDGKLDIVAANHNGGQPTLAWLDSRKLTQGARRSPTARPAATRSTGSTAWSAPTSRAINDGRKEMAVVCGTNERGETNFGQVRFFKNISQ